MQGDKDEDCEEWEARPDGSFCRVYHPALDQPALKQVAVSLEGLGIAMDDDDVSSRTAASAASSSAECGRSCSTAAAMVDMEEEITARAASASDSFRKKSGRDGPQQAPPKRPKYVSR